MFPAFLLAMFYPNVGAIAGLISAFGSMLCIYALPLATYVSMLYQGILPPRVTSEEALDQTKIDDDLLSSPIVTRKRTNTSSFSGEKFLE
jgi:hypothetical protein